MYEYRATVVHVVDGDTVDLQIDLGMHVKRQERVRLMGINAQESFGKDANDAGRAAKAWLIARLPEGSTIVVKTEKDKKEKFGRLLATITVTEPGGAQVNINEEMIALGFAKAYDGHGPRE